MCKALPGGPNLLKAACSRFGQPWTLFRHVQAASGSRIPPKSGECVSCLTSGAPREMSLVPE
eukprot:13879779-Alexandrium_andersonii.AAC.1